MPLSEPVALPRDGFNFSAEWAACVGCPIAWRVLSMVAILRLLPEQWSMIDTEIGKLAV